MIGRVNGGAASCRSVRGPANRPIPDSSSPTSPPRRLSCRRATAGNGHRRNHAGQPQSENRSVGLGAPGRRGVSRGVVVELRSGRMRPASSFSRKRPAGESVRLLGRDGRPAAVRGVGRRGLLSAGLAGRAGRRALGAAQVGQPWLRTIGWFLSLWGVTTVAALAVPWLSPGPVVGAGGRLGAVGKALLQTQFANVGSYILAISAMVGGLLLATELGFWCGSRVDTGSNDTRSGGGVLHVGAGDAQKLGQRGRDLDDAMNIASLDSKADVNASDDSTGKGPAIRRHGRPADETVETMAEGSRNEDGKSPKVAKS